MSKIHFDNPGDRASRASASTLVFEYMARRLYDMYQTVQPGEGRHRA